MKWLVVTDVHGNLTALEAVLDTPQARGCDRVISLGDHSNFGPQPRQVLDTLEGLGAVMLLGNHEERLSHLADPAFAGYNWGILRWTADQLAGRRITFPTDYQIGPVWCTHGVPGDPYKLVDGAGAAQEMEKLPDGARHLLSGHNHASWRVEWGDRWAVNPGSTGALEDPVGGMAAFAVLDVCGWEAQIERFLVPYDIRTVARAYLAGGSAQAAPQLTRLIYNTMRFGEISALALFRHVAETAGALGLDPGSEAAWQAGDATFGWPEKMTSPEFWRMMEGEPG